MRNYRCRRCCCMNNNMQNVCLEQMENSCNNVYSPIEYNDDCECGFGDEELDVFPSNSMLAQSYVPIQFMDRTFKPCSGLENGTIFPELVSPYMPCDSKRDIDYIRNSNSVKEGCNS